MIKPLISDGFGYYQFPFTHGCEDASEVLGNLPVLLRILGLHLVKGVSAAIGQHLLYLIQYIHAYGCGFHSRIRRGVLRKASGTHIMMCVRQFLFRIRRTSAHLTFCVEYFI